MKVLILNNHFNIGGITSYILNLSRGLEELGVKVYIASSGGNAEGELNSEHIRLPLKTKSEISPKLYFSYLKLKPLLKEIDIIHANTRITRVLAHKLSSHHLPYISTVHGYQKPKIKNRLLSYWGKKIIAVSEFVRRHLVSEFKVPIEKIEVIYDGIDIESFQKFSSSSEKLKREAGYEGKFLILTVSRLSDVKGIQYLLKAFKLFLEKFPESILLITGEGKEKDKLQKLIKILALTQNVKLLGMVRDVRPLLKMVDMFVQPSLIEGLGIAIIEALAMGKVVVATDSGGIPEIIKNGYNGILVAPADPESLAQALLKVKNDPNLIQMLIQNANKNLEKFNYKKMAQKTYKVYQNLLRR